MINLLTLVLHQIFLPSRVPFENTLASVAIADSDLFTACRKEKHPFKSVFSLINICENRILSKYELRLYFKEMGGIS